MVRLRRELKDAPRVGAEEVGQLRRLELRGVALLILDQQLQRREPADPALQVGEAIGTAAALQLNRRCGEDAQLALELRHHSRSYLKRREV